MNVRGSVQQVPDGRLLFVTDRVPSGPAQGRAGAWTTCITVRDQARLDAQAAGFAKAVRAMAALAAGWSRRACRCVRATSQTIGS
jgi:hypothetical protein